MTSTSPETPVVIDRARLEAWIAYWSTFDPDKDSEVESECVIVDMRAALSECPAQGTQP